MDLLNTLANNIPILDLFTDQHDQGEYQYQDEELDGLEDSDALSEKNFDESIIGQHLKMKFYNTLKQEEGKKLLLLDNRLRNIFDMIVSIKSQDFSERAQQLNGFEEFKEETGVEKVGILTTNNVYEQSGQIVFFIYPDLRLVELISSIILGDQQRSVKRKYCCVMVPKISSICQSKLQGVMSNISLRSFNFDLIPLGQDLYSLEIQNALQEIYFDKEQNVFQLIADSLQRIQLLYGSTTKIFGIGNAAKGVIQVIRNKEKGGNILEDDGVDYKVLESIIIIDRLTDLVTPLCTPSTYQALLDELHGFNANQVNVSKKIVDDQCPENDNEKIQINMSANSDHVFASISNLNLAVALSRLDEKRIENKNLLEKFKKNMNSVTIEEREKINRDGFKKFQNHCYLANHLMITYNQDRHLKEEANILLQVGTSEVMEYLQNIILFEYPLEEVLRLLCLLCQVQGGLKDKDFDNFRKLIIQSYGIHHMATLQRLEVLGFLKRQKSSRSGGDWDNLVNKLNLNSTNENEEDPDDISYVYQIYAPISVRLVEQSFKKEQWKGIENELKLLGPAFFLRDNDPRAGLKPKKKKIVIVYYVGGVTYGEVAALRLLGKLYNREIVVCTTNLINSKGIFKAAFQINQES